MNIKKFLHNVIPKGSPLWLAYRHSLLTVRKISSNQSLSDHTIYHYIIHNNIVLHDYGAIYFPIPKVACSSLEAFCADLLGMELVIKTKKLQEDIHYQHFPCVKRYQIRKKYNQYFKFCFVRNPWDRLVSCYMNKLNLDLADSETITSDRFLNFSKNNEYFSRNMSFEDFVVAVCNLPDDKVDAHLVSQYRYLTDNSEVLLADFIGRFENFNDDFNYVRNRLGIKDKNLGHLMKSHHNNYRSYYTYKTKALVERRYQRDINSFGYKF